jgi:RNA polymerase sigma factor (sigma-70 family)
MDELIASNIPYVRETVGQIYREFDLSGNKLGVTFHDLEQAGCVGLWKSVERYDPSKGVLFLTYAAKAIRSSMIDLIRKSAKLTENESYQPWTSLETDRSVQNRLLNALTDSATLDLDLIGDPYRQNPEQIYIRKELFSRLYRAMDNAGARSKAYLLYRFGFEDGCEHSVRETAEHFMTTKRLAEHEETAALSRMRREMAG